MPLDLAITPGTTSLILPLTILDSSSTVDAGLATVDYSKLSLAYSRDDDGDAGATVVSLSAGTRGAWSSGGVAAKDSTNAPGAIEVGVPNAAIAAGSRVVTLHIRDAGSNNVEPLTVRIQLAPVPSQLADGVAHGGIPGSSTATLAMQWLCCNNPTGDGITSTGGAGSGMRLDGTAGDYPGLWASGDPGIFAQATVEGGNGFRVVGNKQVGFFAAGGTPFAGAFFAGSGAPGAIFQGNAPGNPAILLRSDAGSDPTILGNLAGTVDGLSVAGLATLFAVDSGKVYADAVTGSPVKEIASNASGGGGGLDAAGVRAAVGLASANLDTQLDALPTAAEAADKLLGRAVAGGADGGRTVGEALAFLRNRWTISGGILTVYAADDSTSLWTSAISTTAGNPITESDPT